MFANSNNAIKFLPSLIRRAKKCNTETYQTFIKISLPLGAKHLSSCFAPGRAAQRENASIFACASNKFAQADILSQNAPRKETHKQKQQHHPGMSHDEFYQGETLRAQLNGQILSKSHFCMLQATNFQALTCSEIARAGELLLELKALRVICNNHFQVAKHFPGAESPGRATQKENPSIFACASKSFGSSRHPLGKCSAQGNA